MFYAEKRRSTLVEPATKKRSVVIEDRPVTKWKQLSLTEAAVNTSIEEERSSTEEEKSDDEIEEWIEFSSKVVEVDGVRIVSSSDED